ncbi:outer membrane lipoprotein-sorting protein [Sinimarinibacterium thermocellulolyticum]|uniref:Outer membrane lipoprotein-sorting protein n=1 Tax=Sinimarinibacterium thermocellulolyticum TaxID=3170016 RepID=A0ABV2AD99_9GAMM
MKSLPRLDRILAAALISTLLAGPAAAETPEEKGLAIAREADRRDEGYGDSAVQMQMILRNRQGEEATREIRARSLEVADDGDKSLIIFDQPKDVEGTALLTWSHKVEDDDRWLYLPALKRVKRIAGNNKSGPFMGSEFAFEDLGSQEVEKYTYKYLRDEACGELTCFVVERYPVDKNSGYTRQVMWIDQTEYRPQKIEFYDRKQSLLKTLEFKDYAQYLDKHWRAARMDMVNHQTGKSTTLLFREYRFRNGYSDRDFDQASLKNAK